ncbi:hypothetical protein H6P81_006296 [Aristolochia fimbriata]|uniref:Uncharacterized protein n=1 Tax=Aristolochia fimbriata TaxID=158543 RepID=A0AAV7F0T4_ARIFI|nr:hypothetical protein H6P81_006296 [Aristolochia fimbriata]
MPFCRKANRDLNQTKEGTGGSELSSEIQKRIPNQKTHRASSKGLAEKTNIPRPFSNRIIISPNGKGRKSEKGEVGGFWNLDLNEEEEQLVQKSSEFVEAPKLLTFGAAAASSPVLIISSSTASTLNSCYPSEAQGRQYGIASHNSDG